MIGLIDCEALNRKTKFIPNLEIMKLYAYYKNEGLARLLLDDSLSDACSLIYVRKDTEESTIPYSWLKDKKVIWGGKAFTNGRYVPLSEDIENTMPSYRVYNNYIKDTLTTDLQKKSPELTYLDYSFIRLHNGYPIQKRHIREGMPLLIYDDDLFIDNYTDKFLIVQQCSPSAIHYVKPVVIHTIPQFDIFHTYRLYSYMTALDKTINTQILLDINFTLREFRNFVYQYKDDLKQFTSGSIIIPAVSSSKLNRNTPLKPEVFEYLANIIFYIISQGIRPNIYKNIATRDNLGKMIQYFADYINTPSYWGFTFKTYINKTKHNEGKKTLKELLKTYPHLNYLFGVEAMSLNTGGIWYGQFRY